MAPRTTTRLCALLAPALAIACEASGEAPRAPRRAAIDAAVDAPTDAPRAAVDAPAPDAGAPRSPLFLFAVGGAELVRPGTDLHLRLERESGGGLPVDVTREATFRVQPAAAASVDPDGTFHALARGRAQVTAALGADAARTIVDVTTEMPAGVTVVPAVQLSGGYVVRSLRFDATPDGAVLLEVHATGLVLSVRGRRGNGAFPIRVPVTGEGAAGTLVLDRWVDHRLEGHAALRVAGRPLQVRFTTLLFDAAPLLGRVAP